MRGACSTVFGIDSAQDFPGCNKAEGPHLTGVENHYKNLLSGLCFLSSAPSCTKGVHTFKSAHQRRDDVRTTVQRDIEFRSLVLFGLELGELYKLVPMTADRKGGVMSYLFHYMVLEGINK